MGSVDYVFLGLHVVYYDISDIKLCMVMYHTFLDDIDVTVCTFVYNSLLFRIIIYTKYILVIQQYTLCFQSNACADCESPMVCAD